MKDENKCILMTKTLKVTEWRVEICKMSNKGYNYENCRIKGRYSESYFLNLLQKSALYIFLKFTNKSDLKYNSFKIYFWILHSSISFIDTF